MSKVPIILFVLITAFGIYHFASLVEVQSQSASENHDLIITSMDMNFEDLFKQWKHAFSKKYMYSSEETFRLKVFIANCRQIYQHNQNKQLNGYTYTLALNHLSDLTQDEYSHLYLRPISKKRIGKSKKAINQLNITLQCTGTITNSPNPPDQVDWSKKAVNPVLQQGQCGSSYAISSIGAVEGLYALRIGKLQQFSIQQVIDCSGSYGNEGCSGGFMDQAFWYMIDNGLTTSKSYPTKNTTDPQKCTYTKSMKITSFSKCADVHSQDYLNLQSAVIQQPTSVAIDATDLQHYDTGIYNGNCSDTFINQGMLAVGYGTQSNQTYWKIKNSLGIKWGIEGYLLLERKQENGTGKCGIQLSASVPQSLA